MIFRRLIRAVRKRSSEVEIIPTCVPISEEQLANESRKIAEFTDGIHSDVGDGAFSPVSTWPYKNSIAADDFNLSSTGKLHAEVHLMTSEPRELGLLFARAGAKRIVGHIEAFSNTDEAHGTLDLWHRSGAEVGLGILLHTPFEVLEPLIPVCDVIHMMSIATIGKQGIPYEPSAVARIAEFHDDYPDILISVDGGVSKDNIGDLVRAGARRFGIGSALMKTPDPASTYKALLALAQKAII